MRFEEQLAEIANENADEIRSDLARSREALARADKDMRELSARVTSLEWISTLIGTEPGEGVGEMNLHDAMTEVLKTAPNRVMRPADLAYEVNRRGLYRMRDGRAVEPGQISARVGNYPHMFAREGTFVKAL